jgi:hypothetical protein
MSILQLMDLPLLAWEWVWSDGQVWVGGIGVVLLLSLLGWKVRRGRKASELQGDVLDCYGYEFEWTCAELESVKGLDRAYYEEVSKELGELGFQKLADVEYLHLSKAHPACRTVVRWFVIEHGQIAASAYQKMGAGKQGLLGRMFSAKRESRVVDFQTAMSDGSFVLTSNAGKLLALESADQIKKASLEEVVSLKEQQDFHIERVKQFCSDSVRPVVAKTREQVMRLEAIQHRLEQEYWFGPGRPDGAGAECAPPVDEKQPERDESQVSGEVEQANA